MRCKTVDFELYSVDMKNSCRNKNIGVFPQNCLIKKGCDTCDQVPCGKCQEGCPKSTCIVNGVKSHRNGCAKNNKGIFPERSTCLSGKITAATFATVAPAPKVKSSVMKTAFKAADIAGECVRWLMDNKDGVQTCIGLMRPKVVKDLLECKNKFNPKKLK